MTLPQIDIHAGKSSAFPAGPSLKGRLLTGRLFRETTADFMLQNASRYGDLVHYTAVGHHVYQLNHPDLVQDFFLRDAGRHHRGVVMKKAIDVLGYGLLTSEEPVHMRQRRLMQPAFHRQRIAAYGEVISNHTSQMTNKWQSGAVIDLHAEMLLLALRIVGKCLFDTNVESEVRRIAAAVDAFMGFMPLAFLPFSEQIQKLPLPSMKRIHRGQEVLNSLIYGIIRERRRDKVDRGDLLSILLTSVDTEDNTGQMTDEQVRDECLTLMLAGHETTANALSFALWLLAQHTEIQEQLHAECSQVLNGRAPTAEDFPRLKYAEKVFAEALRLYPPVWVTARTCVDSYEIAGYRIPQGAILLAPQIALHHDARFWENPEWFDPERFTEQGKTSRPRFSYFPFGAGSRQCIGEGLAWMEGVLVLAAIVQQWKIGHVPGSSRSLTVTPAITLRPKGGLPLNVERRPG
jgi:cytochrome P450